jgi:hypothetical protein
MRCPDESDQSGKVRIRVLDSDPATQQLYFDAKIKQARLKCGCVPYGTECGPGCRCRVRSPLLCGTAPYYGFFFFIFFGGFFNFFSYYIQHCFICRPSDSTVPTDAGFELRTVATGALAVRCSNHLARSHPNLARSHPYLARSHPYLARSHPYLARSHP